MKKLRDKDASKSKKSTSQASKKKFDDSGRSLLPKDFITAKQLYSLGGMPHVLNVWIFECYSEHSYKNIQPTIEEVSRLNLSFSKDFETCDPTTYASTFDSGNLKRTTDELQQRVDTIAEEFGDFSTIPSQKILIKADFASPVSPDQPLKKRKAVMFKQNNQAVMVDDTSGRDHAVQHVSDLYSETHKDATDKGEIGVSEIQHHHHGEIAELVTLISKIPTEVIKALKNEENKQSQEEKIDEQQQSQEDGSNKQERPHKEDMQDVNAANKEAGREDDFENEDYSDLQALEDEIMAYEEECSDEELGKKKISDVEDLSLQALKAKAPVKRERKKSRILRSPYISKYDFGSKDAVDFDKEEKMKYAFDGYNINLDLPNELMIDYSQCIAVGLLKTRSANQCARYAFLLSHYGMEKANEGYMSDNGDPPRPRKSVIKEIDASAIVTLE
ncbi:hypothetical protein FXO38_10316 [Capsicum annuum]|nr:hypothetical protein FXO38_10316 [Capsicum annuum]